MRRIIVLGATGSIGTTALELIARYPDDFQLVAVSAGSDIEKLREIAIRFGLPEAATALGAEESAELVRRIPADVVLNGITGSAGLAATLAALETDALLALANKESLIIGGELVTSRAREGQLVPVDSEHSAIAQALRSGEPREVSRLILTASGGPFRGKKRAELAEVNPSEALAHPTWNMGKVITTNSATLVNKGLEVIEAHLLFNIPLSQIDVVVHPQSIVHSMVQFSDGSIIAQASPPDMTLPIALGISWPHRLAGAMQPLDFSKAQDWTFEPLDEEAFGAIQLARKVGQLGMGYPAVFNAANEVAVDRFHNSTLSFLGITDLIAAAVDAFIPLPEMTLTGVLGADAWARNFASNF